MHLVFLNQYHPPDVAPTGVMLGAVVEQLAADGHRVTVLCAAGGYAGGSREDEAARASGGTRVMRIGATRFGRGTHVGKLADYLTYYLGVAWQLAWMSPRPDRIVALTTPPYLSVLARVFSRMRGGDHAHWVMDLYPNVMVAHGMIARNGILHQIFRRLARFGFGGRRCAAILTLGPDMAERIQEMMVPRPGTCLAEIPVQWVPLWSAITDAGARFGDAPPPPNDLRRERGWADDDLVVMYSGNMGLGHCFGSILDVAAELSREDAPLPCPTYHGPVDLAPADDPTRGIRPPSPVRFDFYGGGKRRNEIRDFISRHPGAKMELHDYVPAEMLDRHLQSADVHLVTLDPEWTGMMAPSKLQGIFAAGRPVIFIGSAASSIGRWVQESGGGWLVEPDDTTALALAIRDASNADERTRRGCAAWQFAQRNFDRKTNVARVAQILAGSTGQ